MDIEKDMTHSDITFLKELENYTLDSKLILCEKYSDKIMKDFEVNRSLMLQENIMPWELEVLIVFSIIYSSEEAKEIFDESKFAEIITKIRNFWHPELTIAEEKGTYPEVFMMISMLQQYPTQGIILEKLFRYNYFFNFKNEAIDMKKEFKDKFKMDYSLVELFAFILFTLMSKETVGSKIDNKMEVMKSLFKMKFVTDMFTIDKKKYKEKLLGLYKENDVDYYYGLKIQYQYPIIEGDNYTYIPAPYLIINAATELLLNRLTIGNKMLRRNFGKEVVEGYLYHIYKEISTIEWISKEFTYKLGKQEHRTADVLVGEDSYCTLFDTKALSPSIKIRKFDREEIEKNINLYAKSIIQVYTQIQNYIHGHYKLEKGYKAKNIFGVVVVLEDSYVSRKAVYERAFDILSRRDIEVTQELKNYINSHVKIIPLWQIEQSVLNGRSYLPCLLKQVSKPKAWNNYNFDIPIEGGKIIPSYYSYIKCIWSRAGKFREEAILNWISGEDS